MSAPAPVSAPTEALAGLVERVTYHNAETGFLVLRVKARGHRDLVTVVGHAASIAAGEWVQLSGTWTNDRTHGLQFRAAFLKASPPTTLEGIERTLGSGMIRGIGFRTADLVAGKLGIEPTAMIRVRAGMSFALAEATGEGHCGLPVGELTAQTAALIEVPTSRIETSHELEFAEGEVVADTLEGERCVFLAGLYRAEQAIAERLRILARGQHPGPPSTPNGPSLGWRARPASPSPPASGRPWRSPCGRRCWSSPVVQGCTLPCFGPCSLGDRHHPDSGCGRDSDDILGPA